MTQELNSLDTAVTSMLVAQVCGSPSSTLVGLQEVKGVSFPHTRVVP
jgi:hypothetical protein